MPSIQVLNMRRDLEKLNEELKSSQAQAERLVRRVQTAVIFAAMQTVVQKSPVLHGAYRAEHKILTEKGILFEHPTRPGPQGVPSSFVGVIPPPSLSEIKNTLAALPAYAQVEILNEIHYAGIIENGNATRSPRQVYAQGLQAAVSTLEQIIAVGGAT